MIPSRSLAALRRQLTLWYLGTFGLTLVLLGAGLFVAIQRQIADQLDQSLTQATQEAIRAARIREIERAQASGPVVDAFDELRIPDRSLFLLDSTGAPIKPATADARLVRAIPTAAAESHGSTTVPVGGGHAVRLHAERFRMPDGRHFFAAAAADRVELESRYASLIAAFGAVAIVALVFVAGGGVFLARKSTAPVERTMEGMRRFMSDAAHELRTPITVVRSRAEVALQREREPAAYVAALHGVQQEAERLGAIVDDLLLLARAEAGERPIARERVYLDDVVADAVAAARAVAERRGVSLALTRYEEAPTVGDPALLRQLVMILLDNATKFTPAGGVVRAEVAALDGHAMLRVEDTGVGITPEQLPRIFDRFWRGEEARASAAGGAGLGLAIARWIAQAHAATIDVDSSPGTGTRVTVRFPIAG